MWTLLKFNAQKQNIFFLQKNPNVMLCQTQINNIEELNEKLFNDITIRHSYHICNVSVFLMFKNILKEKKLSQWKTSCWKMSFLKLGIQK